MILEQIKGIDMSKYFMMIMALTIILSCKPKTHTYKEKDIQYIKKFQHIVETPKKGSDDFVYTYSEQKLTKEEVEVLKSILNKNQIDYYISKEGDLYFNVSHMPTMGREFLIDSDLIDSMQKIKQ